MGEIILVRHGQANSQATTEEDYDRLSDLGHVQAKWLGEWMRAHDQRFDHVVSGTMRRHRETVRGMGFEADEDARLNELETKEVIRFGDISSVYRITAIGRLNDASSKITVVWRDNRAQGEIYYWRQE